MQYLFAEHINNTANFQTGLHKLLLQKRQNFKRQVLMNFILILTGMDKFFDPFKWTIDLREEIINETKLPISFGLASNKLIAKIATDEAKPNGYLFIQHGKEKEFLAPLPVKKIPGVGNHTLSVLNEMGIEFIGDILNKTQSEMEMHLGKWGFDLWNKAQGLHFGSVNEWHEAKSISTENTFETNTSRCKIFIK